VFVLLAFTKHFSAGSVLGIPAENGMCLLAAAFRTHLGTTWEQLGNNLGTTWEQLGNNLGTTWEQLGNNLGTTWESLGNHLGTFGNALEQMGALGKRWDRESAKGRKCERDFAISPFRIFRDCPIVVVAQFLAQRATP
jgi:hypothetical protein